MAAWDLAARQRGVRLSTLLGGSANVESHAPASRSASRTRSTNSLERVEIELAAGYRRIKIKIKPGWDVDAVDARPRAVSATIPLMVDANAAYDARRRAALGELDRFDLMMIEQPLDYDDLRDHAGLQQRLRTPICLDESIHTVKAAAGGASTLGACRIINIKPGRVGGHAESIRLHDLCRGARHPGVARRHARERHRPRPQHPPRRRCRTSRCPATSPPAGGTTRPI